MVWGNQHPGVKAAALGLALIASAGLADTAEAQSRTVHLDAVIAPGGQPLQDGVTLNVWQLGSDGSSVVAQGAAAPARVDLSPGKYRVVATYGDARRIQDIVVGDGAQQRHTINLNAGEVELSLLPEIAARPVNGPLDWEVRRYTRGSEPGRKVVDIQDGQPQLLLSAGWYEVEVQHGDASTSHVIEVAPGQRYDYSIVMSQR